jgi:hypothetical protein
MSDDEPPELFNFFHRIWDATSSRASRPTVFPLCELLLCNTRTPLL